MHEINVSNFWTGQFKKKMLFPYPITHFFWFLFWRWKCFILIWWHFRGWFVHAVLCKGKSCFITRIYQIWLNFWGESGSFWCFKFFLIHIIVVVVSVQLCSFSFQRVIQITVCCPFKGLRNLWIMVRYPSLGNEFRFSCDSWEKATLDLTKTFTGGVIALYNKNKLKVYHTTDY